MTYKESLTAILECHFTGFKKEIIDSACNRILELEPCEDAISRQSVMSITRDFIGDPKYTEKRLVDNLNKLSPTKSQETKTGHWITTRTLMHDGEYYCDKCNCDSPHNEKWDYCPNCGAKMESKR